MPEWLKYVIYFAIMAIVPYLLSGMNSAIIVTKIKTGEDIRTMGSGGAGLTNTLRTQGKAAAVFVLLGDVLKGVVSVIIVRVAFLLLFSADITAAGYTWSLYAAGLSAILGHVFPVYFGFKGGKGVLVTVSVLLAIDWIPALILLGIFGVIVAISRYVSLGSIIAAILYPFTVLIFGIIEGNQSYIANFLLAAVIAALIVFMHRSNIKRLKNHTENRLGQKKKTAAEE